MKIGEFAGKHHVTIDTVRHYIAEGLLTPLRENTQYNFSDIDSRVMDTILLLKNMNFKLDEMKAYLLFHTMFAGDFSGAIEPFKTIFEEKLEQNKAEIKRLEEMNRLIGERLKEHSEEFAFKRGIALSLVSGFKCPVCGKELELADPELLHNEIMSGRLICPECGKTYYIRYGILSDEEISDIDFRTEGISEMIEDYLKENDNEYVLGVREFFQKTADIAKEHCGNAKNIMISGDSAGFLNSVFLRSMSENARLFIHFKENVTSKYFLEDLFPKETVMYSGNIKKAPFSDAMDYIFWQDYDIDAFSGKEPELYPNVSPDAIMDCLKVLIVQKPLNYPGEDKLISDMEKTGWRRISDHKTPRIIRRRESSDLSGFDIDAEVETQYGIYSFKTLG